MPIRPLETLASREAKDSRGVHYRITDIIGGPMKDDRHPQAYITEVTNPGGTLPPHFHRVNQFHVYIGGSGTVGKQSVKGVTVHYVDASTPYGPIVAGPQGIEFLVIRVHAEGGLFAMPESREKMPHKAGRNLVVPAQFPAAPASGVAQRTVVEQEDGAGAVALSFAPGAATPGPDPAGSGGHCYAVLEGSLRCDGVSLGRKACIHITPTDHPPRLAAGPNGARVLLLRFPPESPPA
jgi:hypothetical protein